MNFLVLTIRVFLQTLPVVDNRHGGDNGLERVLRVVTLANVSNQIRFVSCDCVLLIGNPLMLQCFRGSDPFGRVKGQHSVDQVFC